MFNKAQRIEITGRAIANRLKGQNLSGERLARAIEEVADDMHGLDTVAGQTLVEINETNVRDWQAVVRQAKKTLAAIG